MERALGMARASTWPLPLGWSLAQTAQVLRLTGRLDAARDLLDEAMAVLTPYQGGRDYFSACISLGHLLLDLGDHQQALARLAEAEQLARTTGFPDLVADSLRGQALALSGLGRGGDAMATGLHALELAQSHGSSPSLVEPLRTLANIAREHRIALPRRSRAPSAPIHYLEQALKAASDIDGYGVPHELYAELSRDYEAVGDWRRALYFERQAVAARENELTKRARDLALAIEIRYKTDEAMAAAEHHKALAELESQRAQTLEASRDTLAHLATVGQEITTKLDAEAVFLALHRHAGTLLDAPSVSIFVLQDDRLELRFGIEDGRPMPALAVALTDPLSNAARCVRERQLLALQLQPDDPRLIPGTRPMPSALFAPLVVDDAVLGVLSIQSARENAYAERERQILRMLAAYGAVALANAAGAQQLAAARAELERQKMRNLLVHAGKLATVGRLASGLIHELSHPVGAIGLSLGSLQALLDLGDADKARELVPEVSHEVARLRTLIQRLRNMARSDPPRIGIHALGTVLRDARQMFGPRLVTEGVAYDEAIEPHEVKADAELLSLAIANVVANAADAMAEAPVKRIEVRTVREGSWVHLAIADSGPGLSPQTEQNLFKPFYTTKPEDNGLGLGLALSAEYLAAMGARIQGGNSQRGGAEFRIALPLAEPLERR
jgi:C4-dicarboxylate-specific signal transduction histidine kinase